MMGGDAANNTDLVKIAGKDAAKGYFFISPPSAHDFDTPEAKDFFSRYKAQYNSCLLYTSCLMSERVLNFSTLNWARSKRFLTSSEYL